MSDWNGVPDNPSADGWHWVMPARGIGITSPRLWHARIARWEMLDGTLSFASEAAEMWRYLAARAIQERWQARREKLVETFGLAASELSIGTPG